MEKSDGLVLRPSLNDKFRSTLGKQILEKCASELLTDQKYSDSDVGDLSRNLCETIRKQLIDLNLPQYKYLVQVMIGEQRGQGARIHSACCWDIDTDSKTFHFYQNDSLFCEMIIFALFTYS